MGRSSIWMALALLLASGAHGQSLAEYLKLRRTLKIDAPASGTALTSLVGTKSFEIRGTVSGVSRVDSLSYVMFRTDDEQIINIRTRNLPDWLTANETVVRLLVKASRDTDFSELTTNLLGAAPDAQIAPVESAEKARITASSAPTRDPGSQSARSTSGLRGTITSRGVVKGGTAPRSWSVPKSDATPIYASFIKKRNPRLSEAQAFEIAQGVIGFSIEWGVDARLIMSILIIESGFNPNATSSAGAMGLGQLMPATAKGLGISQPYDTTENLYGTVRTIRGHLERYHKKTGGDGIQSLILALAAYNAGSGAVRKYNGVPPYAQTQAYVRKVISVYEQLTGQPVQ